MKKILDMKLNNFIFFLSYGLMLFNVMFRSVNGLSEILPIIGRIYVALLIFNCVINLNKINYKVILAICAIVIIAYITKYTSNKDLLFILCLFVVACKDIELEKIIKFDIALKIPFLIIIVMLFYSNLTSVNIHYRDGIARYSMGFSNPNLFSAFIFSIVTEWLYLRRNKINILDFIIVGVSIYIINYYADSRTQILSLILLSVLLLMNKYTKKIFIDNKLINFLTKNIFIIVTIISISLIVLYKQGNPIAENINSILSGRIRLAAECLEEYKVNLFGNNIKLVSAEQAKTTGEKQVALDNLYVFSLLSFGIIAYAFIYIATRRYFQSTIDEKEDVLRLIMVIFFLGGLMERFAIALQFNIFLFYFSHMLYSNEKYMKKIEREES